MDNKHLEEQAENYLKSQLSRFNFHTTKPSFDKGGSDLILVKDPFEIQTKILIVQSKGRTVSKDSTSVVIPSEYVKDNFVLFIYTIDSTKKELLFLFFPTDIRRWNLNNKNEYRISFNINTIKEERYQEKIFDQAKAKLLQQLLFNSPVKPFTTLIIDGLFLEKAILEAITFYKDLYTDKELIIPTLPEVIKNILLQYNRFKTENNTVKVLYIRSKVDFNPSYPIHVNSENQFFLENKIRVNIFKQETDNIIAFDVMEEMDKLVDTNNIILVADDLTYEPKLIELENQGIKLIVVRTAKDDGTSMFIKSKWGDVNYPLAASLGLKPGEI